MHGGVTEESVGITEYVCQDKAATFPINGILKQRFRDFVVCIFGELVDSLNRLNLFFRFVRLTKRETLPRLNL